MKKIAFAMAMVSLLLTPTWVERFTLTDAPGAPYHVVTLSEDIYARAHEAILADLRILNGDGEPVPSIIDIPYDPPPQTRTPRGMHWFATPIDGAQRLGAAGVVFGTDGVLRTNGA